MLSSRFSSLPMASSMIALLQLQVFGLGCADAQDLAPARDRQDEVGVKKFIYGDLPSANYLLFPNDVAAFRAGKTKDDVLKDVKWRGNFGMACEYKGKGVSAITYELVLQPKTDTANIEGEWMFAIFVDDKFEKFVRPGTPNPTDMEEVPYEGTTWSRPKPVTIGDTSRFIRDIGSEAVDLAVLKKELKTKPKAPSQIDPGLTIAFLLLKSKGLAPAPATVMDYKRNAQLRDQFNGARLKIGMSPEDVQTVFKAKPLQTGKVAAGDFQVYGSNDSFDIDPALLYSNVLVLFKDGKANVIYAIEGGRNWRQKAQERFSDFPRND